MEQITEEQSCKGIVLQFRREKLHSNIVLCEHSTSVLDTSNLDLDTSNLDLDNLLTRKTQGMAWLTLRPSWCAV